MNTSHPAQPTAPKTIRFDDSALHILLQDGTEISAALTRFPRLLQGSAEQRNEWRVIGGGDGIHWPSLDEDISIPALRRPGSTETPAPIAEVMGLVGKIYANSQRLSQITQGRRFTLDGLFVSTTGQVVAEYIYGLSPEPDQRSHDARTKSGQTVQIMLIGQHGKRYAVRWTETARAAHADILLCLKVGQGGFEEIYNGNFPIALLADRLVPKNGQVHLSLHTLSDLNPALLSKEHSFASINRLFQSTFSDAA